LVANEALAVLREKNAGKLTEERIIPEYLEAPLLPDQSVGEIRYLDESGSVEAVLPLYPDQAVECFGFLDILFGILSDFTH